MAKLRADEQKQHTRPGFRASQHDMTKPADLGDRVNAAVVQRQFTFLSGEICPAGGRKIGSTRCGNAVGSRAEVSRGHSTCRTGREGLNTEKARSPMSLRTR
jgi:hypothetical protein